MFTVTTIADLVGHVAWPLVMGIAIWVFRKPVITLLSERSLRLSFAGTEISASQPVREQRAAGEPSARLDDTTLSKYEYPIITEWRCRIEDEVERVAKDFTMDRYQVILRGYINQSIELHFERVYHTIFGSQLNAIQELVKHGGQASRDIVKPYYDTAAASYPTVYASYSFDAWLSYLVTSLIVVVDGDLVQLTNTGREFIPYLTRRSYHLFKYY